MDREQAVADAKDMADQLAVFATEHGWRMKGEVKANKKYAFVTLEREYQQEDGDLVQEELRAFYAINPATEQDQVTYTGPDGVATVLDVDAGDVRASVTRELPTPAPRSEPEGPTGTIVSGLISVDGEPVPPTVPPTSQDEGGVPPTETSVPPTGDADAAHPIDTDQALDETHAAHEGVDGVSAAHLDRHGIEHNDMRTDAAHLTVVDPNEIDDAAHQDASRMVPPTGRTVVEDFHIVPPADEEAVASEALQHAAQAKEHGADVYSQQDVYGAVRQQQVAPYKNWSPVLSDLSSDEILVKLGVNRKSNNRLDITWMNSLSNTLDRATVDGGAEKHPPHITPVGFDPQAHGEDLRVLHFLEVNGGFRSVAIARIRKIG